jgi:hypothetical protein
MLQYSDLGGSAMNLRLILGFLALASLFFPRTSPSLAAQTASEVSVAPDGGTTTHIQGISVPQIANSPFSAKEVVEWARPLADGTVVTRKYYTNIARDTQGRVHREDRNGVPANSTHEPVLNYTYVLDPAARTRTECYPSTRICRVTSYRPVTVLREVSAVPSAPGNQNLKREPLGNDSMESLDVTGTRETLTIPAESIGNDHEFAITKEIWYSPQLQLNLSVVRTDPRIGKQTLKLTELTLAEPDASFFEVPAGYRVVDERKPTE